VTPRRVSAVRDRAVPRKMVGAGCVKVRREPRCAGCAYIGIAVAGEAQGYLSSHDPAGLELEAAGLDA